MSPRITLITLMQLSKGFKSAVTLFFPPLSRKPSNAKKSKWTAIPFNLPPIHPWLTPFPPPRAYAYASTFLLSTSIFCFYHFCTLFGFSLNSLSALFFFLLSSIHFAFQIHFNFYLKRKEKKQITKRTGRLRGNNCVDQIYSINSMKKSGFA